MIATSITTRNRKIQKEDPTTLQCTLYWQNLSAFGVDGIELRFPHHARAFQLTTTVVQCSHEKTIKYGTTI